MSFPSTYDRRTYMIIYTNTDGLTDRLIIEAEWDGYNDCWVQDDDYAMAQAMKIAISGDSIDAIYKTSEVNFLALINRKNHMNEMELATWLLNERPKFQDRKQYYVRFLTYLPHALSFSPPKYSYEEAIADAMRGKIAGITPVTLCCTESDEGTVVIEWFI